MKMKNMWIVAVIVIPLLGALFWVIRSRPKPIRVPAGSKPGDSFLTACHVKIGKVQYAADCGALIVPENRANPASRLIAIPLMRIHSPDALPAEPVFHLEGGPGTSNMGYRPKSWILAHHDVVLVGYRGVDGSSRLDCPEFTRAARGGGGDLLSPEWLEQMGHSTAECARRLAEEGVDLAGYSIPETVEDIETARKILGYERINLLSESYGTRVAQIYAGMHPASLNRSAMIGVNPPGHFLWLPETVDSQIVQYGNLWRQAEGADAPDLAGAMRSVNKNMPSRWLFLPINPGKVKMIAFVLLFHRTTSPMVFDAYLAAQKGDPSGLALMSVAYDLMLPNMMTWGEFFAIGSSADFEPGRDYRTELNPPDSILGAPMSLMIWGSCAGNWPPSLISEEFRQVQPSSVETLLVSGTVDFSTPAQFASEELLPSLQRGTQVILAEQGHTGDFWQYQTEASERLLTSFFDTGQADSSLYTYLPMDFQPRVRFPTLAKLLMGTGVLLLLALGGSILALLRRIRPNRGGNTRRS